MVKKSSLVEFTFLNEAGEYEFDDDSYSQF
jgi:hypothetical protein